MFRKILIANRGEIAIRIARACREMGVACATICSEADRSAPHVRAVGEVVCVGPAPSRESYLNVDAVIGAARKTGADAIHPGYGFLSESAEFARAVADAGLTFIGPPASAIAVMGDKTAARAAVAAVGVPVVPAVEDPPREEGALRAAAERIGYPLLIKAAAGGGGKGMRIVRCATDLLDSFAAAQREAGSAFGDGRVFFERYIERPRHVEVQILADPYGNIIHLGERECSIQRRHQKIIEETPSPCMDAPLRERMTAAAIAAARRVKYINVGTVEFLLTESGAFYFLEMNTRLQVEHPVTEWIYGVDLVQAQIRVAAGEKLWLRQEDVAGRGHSIECRVYAEDPARQFLPCPGRIVLLTEPGGPSVRVDSGIAEGYEVSLHYDPLLAKVSVWGSDRETARHRMIAALREYVVLGISTSIPFLLDILRHPAFASGHTHTHFIEDHLSGWQGDTLRRELAAIAAGTHFAMVSPAPAHCTRASRSEALSPWQNLGAWRLGTSG
jgi:acetyl-CoA carboxylase biotin carboxylase subunit